jgi:predicted alpha/beta hydrolase
MQHTVTGFSIVAARRRVRPLIVIAIAAAATALAWIAGRTAHVNYLVGSPFGTRQITLALTVAATAVAGLVGWGVLALLERYTSRARGVWIVLAVAVVCLSIAPVFATPADLDTRLALSALHCVAAAVLIPGLPQPR